jgi:predicted Zn-dependent peptidase
MIRELEQQPGERPFRVATLGNGLRVAVVPQPHLSRAHVSLYLRVGSRYETAATNGISHFLEHMIYRGSPRLRTAHDVNHAFESLGGYLYAATQTDFGVFSVTVPPENLARAADLFGEVLSQPTFADMEIEKEIVCEEILEDLDDEGRMIDADNISRQMIYPSHPLGFTITGDEKQVRAFDERTLRAHHERHYTTANAVLGFAGAVDYASAFALAEEHFATMPRGEEVLSDVPVHAQKKPRFKIVENSSSQTELRVCFRAVGEQTEWRPAIDMLMRILDDGMSTRLYHRICDDKGLCYDVCGAFEGYEDDGILDFAAGCQHARSSVITKEILEMLVDLAEGGPTEDELAKARRRNAWETRQMFDVPEEVCGVYAGGVLFERFETPEARLANNGRVTAERIRDLCRMVVQPDRLNVLAVGLLEKDEEKRLADAVRSFKGPAR